MNVLDIVLVVIMAAFIVYGAVKGIVRLALGSIAVALGVFLGCWYNAPAASALSGWIQNEPVRRLVALALIFLATLAAFAVLVWFITKTLEAVKLRWLDRLSGAALGLLVAALLAAALLVPLVAFLPADSSLVGNSTLSPYVLRVSSFVKSVVPEEMRRRYEEAKQRMVEAGKGILPGGEKGGDAPSDPNAKAPAKSPPPSR